VFKSALFITLLAIGRFMAAQDRLPAVPLITHNPYFSIWSMTDSLTDGNTRHWTGSPQPISGIARIDGASYRFIGKDPEGLPALHQTLCRVTATRTEYEFDGAGIRLHLEFFTPAFTDDLDLLSRPVTYISFSVRSESETPHQVSLLIDVDPVISVNDRSQKVVTSRHQTEALEVLSVGSHDQNVLNRSGDDLRIDWGYFHLAVPKDQHASTAMAQDGKELFIKSGKLPANDSIGMPVPANHSAPHLDAVLNYGAVSSTQLNTSSEICVPIGKEITCPSSRC
jgi:hypothetical protein